MSARTLRSNGGHISLTATGGTITLETITTDGTSGNVRLVAGASILDGDANGDTDVDITAAGLFMSAGSTTGAIGTSANH
ncbi:hypothetical protein JZU54_02495, partial [bacterium]|nr:hypothetical protein [bacterium]